MEDHFKEKLKNHKVDWDKDVLLESLKKELSQKNEGFRWKWILLLPLLFIGTCWGWNYNIDVPEKYTQKSIASDISVSENKEKKPNLPHNKKDTKRTTTQTELNSLTQPDQNLTKTNHSVLSTGQKENTSQELKNNNTTSKSSRTDHSSLKESIDQYANETVFNDHDKIRLVKTNIQNSKPAISATQERSNTTVANTLKVKNGMLPIKYLTTIQAVELPIDARQLNLKFNKNEKVILNDKNNDTANQFYVSASTEIGLVKRTTNFSDVDFLEPLVANEETEKSLFLATANLKLGYQFRSGLSMQSGLELNQLVEVFKLNTIKGEEFVPVEKVRYFIVDDRDTTFIMDTVNVLRTEERRVRNYNKHTFYTIPFELGYNWNIRKAKVISRVGMSYTFSHNYKGKFNYIFEEDFEIIESNGDFNYDLTSRIGFQLGLGLEYPIMKRSQFYVNATFRRSPNLRIGIKTQKYNSLSLGAGIRVPLR